jgi:sialic acid synthase SpsE
MVIHTKPFQIDGRLIGPHESPLVIAEVGINHEGDITKAFQLIDAAVAVNCEVIKFQCHITEKEMVPTDITPGNISKDRLWDIIKRCELTQNEEYQIQEYCQKKGIIYLSTPFSREAADRLNRMGVPAFKIGSGECNNVPLLQHIAAFGKPIILSTGMNDLKAISNSVNAIQKFKVPLALMHCTSIYPTPYENVRLGALSELIKEFPTLPIGTSDHSINIWTSLGAVSLGACILEKHFTITRSWPGPDISLSIEPQELANLIEGSKAIWSAMGGSKTILKEEQPVIDFAYASIVTIAPIKKGHEFSMNNTWVKRPGISGIRANQLNEILGKTATRDLSSDIQISIDDVDGLSVK